MPKYISSCSSNSYGPALVSIQNNEKFNWKIMQLRRKKIIELFNQGVIPKCCTHCYLLKENKDNLFFDSEKIKALWFSHWYHCNCRCIYCVHREITQGKNYILPRQSSYYNVLPIVKYLINNNLLDKNPEVCFSGGEITLLKEFNKIVDLLLKNTTSRFYIFSSGIRYDKTIEKCFKLDRAYLNISLDSGCRETYKKIKRIDKYNTVIKNITKYLNTFKTARDFIFLKYIIIKGYNDNIEEISKWLNTAESIGIKNVRLDIDYNLDKKQLTNNLDNNYYNLFKFFKTQAAKQNFNIDSIEYVEQILEKGFIF